MSLLTAIRNSRGLLSKKRRGRTPSGGGRRGPVSEVTAAKRAKPARRGQPEREREQSRQLLRMKRIREEREHGAHPGEGSAILTPDTGANSDATGSQKQRKGAPAKISTDLGMGLGQPQEMPIEGEGSASAAGTESCPVREAPTEKADGDDGFFSGLFKPMAEEDATPIGSLIDSLPDIPVQELANDAQEVRGLLLRRRNRVVDR